jgi:hypothetical protein
MTSGRHAIGTSEQELPADPGGRDDGPARPAAGADVRSGEGSGPGWIARILLDYAWLCFAFLAATTFGIVWAFLPHVREGVTLPEFALKITAFVLAVFAVAAFPQHLRLSHLLLSIPSLVFLGFIIPKMMWLFLQGPHTEPEYYTYLWSLNYPGILLSIALAFRIGGGSAGKVIKLGLNGVILVFSGYLELMWFVVNPWDYYDLPSIPHVEVIIGFFPTYTQLFVFALLHIPLLVAVNLAPIDRWLEMLRARLLHGTHAEEGR